MILAEFEDFEKLDIRIGEIKSAEKIEKSDKLLKLKIDVGQEKQCIAGIAKDYSPSELVGKKVVVVTNLEPVKLMGLVSEVMILAADVDGKAILLKPDRDVKPGTKIR